MLQSKGLRGYHPLWHASESEAAIHTKGDAMSGKEILLKAIRNEPTPRPAWVPFVGVHGGKIIGATAADYLQSSELIVRGLNRAAELYQPDGLPIVFDLQLEAEVLGCAMRWADDTPPSVASHPLADTQDDAMPPFDPAGGRFPVVLDATRQLRKSLGDRIALYGLITGPFTLGLHLLGTHIFLEMFSNPDRVKRVLDYCAEVGRRTADLYIDQGVDIVAVVDPMTSQISPDHFATFVTEPVNALFDHIRQRGAHSSLFVCGNATRNLELMCNTHCDNVSIDENIDLAELRTHADTHDKSFGGNLKLTTVLLLGSTADAQRDAIRCIDTGGQRGFILAPGCDLPYATPEANLQAVAAIVHDEYKRQVARTLAPVEQVFEDVALPDYARERKVIIDIITLDSASCAPCQYMVDSVVRAANAMGEKVLVREHKITTQSGLGHMAKLGVGQIPTICIDGQVAFPSIIPDMTTLTEAIIERIEAKSEEK